MGLLNKLWSGADFWDKKENKQQRDQFKAQDDEDRKRKAAEAQARAQAQAQQQAQQDAQRASTPNVSVNDIPRKPTTFGQNQPQPEIIKQLYKSTQPTPNPLLVPQVQQAPAPVKRNKFGNPEPYRGVENGKAGTYYTGKVSGKPTFLPDPVKEDNSVWGKVKRNLDIGRKTVQGTVGAVPQVALAAGRTATGLVQGAGQLPHMATAIAATGTEKLADAWGNPVTRGLNTGAQGLNTGVKTATHYAINNTFDPINRNIDEASRMYGRTVQDSEEMGTKNYEQTQIGLNALAVLLTGGAAAATKVGQAGKMGKVSSFLNKPIAGSADDIISKIGGGAIDNLSGAANALNAPFGSAKNKLTEILGGSNPASEIGDAASATIGKADDIVVQKPNEVAPGVVSTNKTPEVIKPEPVVRPPEPTPVKPEPIKTAPKIVTEAPRKPVVPKTPEENLAGLKGQRDSLAAERDDMLTNGEPTKDIERQIKSLDNAIAEQTTPPKTPEAKAIADGDKQLAEAEAPKVTTAPVKPKPEVNDPNPVQNTKPEISKQEAPKKPKKEADKVRQMTEEEMRATDGMSEETIATILAKRAEAAKPVKKAPKKAAKVVEPEKVDVAQSSPTPVKSETGKGWTDEGVAEIKREGAAMGATPRQVSRQVSLYKQENPLPKTVAEPVATTEPVVIKRSNPNAKTVAEPDATPIATAEPVVPKAPTQRQLNKSVVDNTNPGNGKVSAAWKKEQKKAGATDEQIAKAVEKVEGRKIPPTESEKQTAARIAENNRIAKENKAKALAEGKDKPAAPNVAKARAKESTGATSTPEERASLAKRYLSYTKNTNIDEGMTAAEARVAKLSDDALVGYARKALTAGDETDEATRIFDTIALSKRLDDMHVKAGDAGVELDKELTDLVDEITHLQGDTASRGGLINRLTQEINKSLPPPVRVQRRLDKLQEKLSKAGKEFNYTDADKKVLVDATRKFDKAATELTGLPEEQIKNMDDYVDLANNGGSEAEKAAMQVKAKEMTAKYEQAQKDAVEHSLTFNEHIKGLMPELSKYENMQDALVHAPDAVANYLRMAMLSAPSGRARDAMSTGLNVIDDIPVSVMRALIGKGMNKVSNKGGYVDSVGSWASLKKGVRGGLSKVKTSWEGGYTLDEATGRIGVTDRSELLHKGRYNDSINSFGIKHSAKGSKYNILKKGITTGVQLPTDATFFKYTEELYNIGKAEASARKLVGKDAKRYAEMFMDSPSQKAQVDASQAWLFNSGMQKNNISKTLSKLTDGLTDWGSKTTRKNIYGETVPRTKVNQAIAKTTANIIRTTTVPFVQYTGGATHAMLTKQNPLVNAYGAVKSVVQKDPQKFVDNLARGAWNIGKIKTLMYVMDKEWIKTSDVDVDGETTSGAPYIIRTKADGTKEYVPASTYGIAGAAAIISAHYGRKAWKAAKEGDVSEALTNMSTAQIGAIFRATGMNNMMTGENVLGGVTASVNQKFKDKDNSASDVAGAAFWGLTGDIGSQAVPAASRDLNTVFDANKNLNPTNEKPDTSGKDPVTGLVDPKLKATAQITSGIPILSQQLPRKSGAQARTFTGRILNANTQTEQQAAKIASDKKESTTVQNRTNDIVTDDKIAKLMSPETKAIYDKYKGDMSKAPKNDRDAVWTDVSAAKDRLLDDGAYDSYNKVLTYERDEAKASGSKTETEIAEMDRKISRAKVAGERKTNAQIFRLYTSTDTPEGGGISQGEFKKMLELDDDGNPKYPEVYDQKTATLLWELDEAMTKAGVSGNANGVDPWTRNKYNLDEALGRGKYAKKGSGGSKDKGVATDFGTLGAYAKPSSGSQAQKYQGVGTGAPLANLTKQSSKTNLKKNISVVKGVRL